MAKLLNCFFASAFTVENNDSIPSILPLLTDENKTLRDIVFQEHDILHTVNKMKTNKTPGPDKIAPKILNEVKNGIIKPLTLFQQIIKHGQNTSRMEISQRNSNL